MLDRSKAKRAADMTQLHNLWRKKIKNDVLYFRLMDRAMKDSKKKEEAAKSKKGKKIKR